MTESTSPGGSRHPGRRLLYRGAEADVIKDRWQGLAAVYKVRKPLRYRLPVLDNAIRRQRTLREAEMLHEAKEAGVGTPYLYDVDVPGSTLVMEYIAGARVRDLLPSMEEDDLLGLFRSFGRDAGRLHAAGIMHGDLTTANVIRRDGELVFIDFGLSIRTDRLEDHAVDLRLIKETLVGAHAAVSAPAMEALLSGYAEVKGEARARAVLRQLHGIERRGRYARVT